MCGIAALFSYHPSSHSVNHEELKQIRDYMTARGPDGFGEWYSDDGRVGLGHRRLSIIDLSESGSQPMKSKQQDIVITFNGEIYNYKELRDDLEKEGVVFYSQSDTEVILHLYEKKGDAMLKDLRGMFAFALWDQKKQAMLLARDPYGIKPLYYADDGKVIRVASQVKALLSVGGVSRERDSVGVVSFFMFGSVPEPYTTYSSVRQLEAGHLMWVTDGGVTETKVYFSIAETLQQPPLDNASKSLSVSEEEEVYAEALRDSVRHHFVSDVPVGVFLSAGIDSSSLVGLAHDCGFQNLKTITLAFDEFKGSVNDEAPLAQNTSNHYQTDHQIYRLGRDEFKKELPRFLHAMDQPTIDGVNTYFVSKAAKAVGLKVALSGLGADEMFGGYPSFQDIPKYVRVTKNFENIPFIAQLFQWVVSKNSRLNPKLSGMLQYGPSYEGAYFLRRGLFMPWELGELIGEDIAEDGLKKFSSIQYIRNFLNESRHKDSSSIASMESSIYMRNQLLRDSDWAGMGHSLEIRVPFVDKVLLEKLSPILNGTLESLGKKRIVNSLNKALPEEVVNRSKTGFVVPIEQWLREDERLDQWRQKKILGKQNCHWSRKWAYVVYKQLQGE